MVVISSVELSDTSVDSFRIANGATLVHRGIVEGDVEVFDGAFVLYGTLHGSLTVADGCRAVIYGFAELEKATLSGIVDVFGVVRIDRALEGLLVAHDG